MPDGNGGVITILIKVNSVDRPFIATDLEAFYRDYYRAGAVVRIVGDINDTVTESVT